MSLRAVHQASLGPPNLAIDEESTLNLCYQHQTTKVVYANRSSKVEHFVAITGQSSTVAIAIMSGTVAQIKCE